MQVGQAAHPRLGAYKAVESHEEEGWWRDCILREQTYQVPAGHDDSSTVAL